MNKIALVGNPNVGKSSLFNLLTGLNQKIANYAGATVEKKSGKHKDIEIVDLPGLQSMWAHTLDEKISSKEILNFAAQKQPILFVANGLQLETSLLLFSQIADLQVPIALVINFKDEVKKNQIDIDTSALKKRVGCEVILMNSKTGEGLEEVVALWEKNQFRVPMAFCRSNYEKQEGHTIVNSYQDMLVNHLEDQTGEAARLYESDVLKRQQLISSIADETVKQTSANNPLQALTMKLDGILLHPLWGTLIFLATLFAIFQAIFALSEWPMQLIDGLFSYFSTLASDYIPFKGLADLVANAVVPGLAGVLIFIPQIAILFFLLGILESTGYMARISYLSDRLLQKFGLSGSSVIPLMSGMACAIPAIMSARAIKNERERLAVILITPFMTCAARLPVYTILIALVFPDTMIAGMSVKGLALFGLYLLGTFTALIAGFFLTRYLKQENQSMWMMELPVYRSPHWRNVLMDVFLKTKSFVVEAGKVIFVISIILWFLASFSPKSEEFITQKIDEVKVAQGADVEQEASSIRLQYSYVGYMGRAIEPVIQPLGYDWKVGIALITSFAAREVFVGTLSTIYSIGSEDEGPVIERMRKERNPKTGEPYFNLATCISLLLFYVFALQCMSTLAIVRKETDTWRWPILQFVGMLVLAYVTAFASYQLLS